MTPEPKRSFARVVGPGARVVVLGTLPGEASLRLRRYYGHSRNQFWRLIGSVIERDLEALAYERRLEALAHARIGLWDVFRSALRQGSLDGNIRAAEPNDLPGLVASTGTLRALAFNGGTALKAGKRLFAGEDPGVALLGLPSSSPAYAVAFETKLASWRQLRAFL